MRIPAPAFPKPNIYVDAALHTGSALPVSVSSLAFSPNLAWIKNRSANVSHYLFDTERSGKPMSFGELRGQVWIATMFFASCPNQCRELNQTVAALHNDPDFKNVKFVSISVDPAVDTPEALSKTADILGADPKRWLFFTGKLDDIVRLGKQAKVEAGYKSHVPRLILFDQQGRIRGYYMFNDAQQIAKLRKEVAKLLAGKSDQGKEKSGQGPENSGQEPASKTDN